MKIEDYNEYYIQGSDHYLIPKDIFVELFNEMTNWKQESEELKKQLNELQKPQVFIDTQDMEEEYGEGLYQDYLEEQVKELKKQLHEASLKIQELIEQDIECPNNCSKLKELLNQQQEFIKYLEDCIKELEKENLNKLQNVLNLGISDITKEILQKYKEIVGVKDEIN